MIEQWILATIFTTCVILVKLLTHNKTLQALGPKGCYSLWVTVPLSLIISLCASPLLETLQQANVIASSPLAVISVTTSVKSALSEHVATDVIGGWVMLIWLVGFVTMLLLMCADLTRLHLKPSARIGSLGLQRTPATSSAAIFGVLRPSLQIPQNFSTQYNAEERRLILQHEITHWRRGDTCINLLAWTVLATQWFNPIAWQAYRRFRADQELACDADVLASSSVQQSANYAKTLLKSISFNPPINENNWRLLSCSSTHYGLNNGSYTMMKERLTSITSRKSSSRLPALLCSSAIIALATAWNLPAQSQPQQESMEINTEVAEAPVAIVRIEPRYPQEAAENGVEGFVDVAFQVNDEGKTQNVKVINSQPTGVFEEAVVDAVKRWRYKPQDDTPVQLRIELKIDKNS